MSKTQKCKHPFYYSIDNDYYCNECHKYLGYFDRGKFVKKTKDTIADEFLTSKQILNENKKKL